VVSWMVVGNSLLYVLVQRRAWGVDKDRARAGGGGGSKNLRCCVRCREACRSVSVRRPEVRGQRPETTRQSINNQQRTRRAAGGAPPKRKPNRIVLWAIKGKGKRKRRKKRRENFSRSQRAGKRATRRRIGKMNFRISWNFSAGA
jgi:hypothetical protein